MSMAAFGTMLYWLENTISKRLSTVAEISNVFCVRQMLLLSLHLLMQWRRPDSCLSDTDLAPRSVAKSSCYGYTKSNRKIYQMYTKFVCNKKIQI